MRAVKCKLVSTSAWPEKPVQYPVTHKYEALAWIVEQGWDHVADGSCTLLRCSSSKAYIDKQLVIKNGHNKPVINHKLGAWL